MYASMLLSIQSTLSLLLLPTPDLVHKSVVYVCVSTVRVVLSRFSRVRPFETP